MLRLTKYRFDLDRFLTAEIAHDTVLDLAPLYYLEIDGNFAALLEAPANTVIDKYWAPSDTKRKALKPCLMDWETSDAPLLVNVTRVVFIARKARTGRKRGRPRVKLPDAL